MKILILGESRHGKDALAEYITQYSGLKFKSSSVAASEAIFEQLNAEVGGIYNNPLQAFEDRQRYKHIWKRLITEYNTPDKARLCREILAEADIYVGMRCAEEYAASRELFDLVLFVYAGERVGYPPTTTMDIKYDPLTMLSIDNNSTKENLKRTAAAICAVYGLGES